MTVLFRSIRPHQVLSEPWRRSIYTGSRNNSINELLHHLGSGYIDLSEFYLCDFLSTDKIYWTLVLEIKLLIQECNGQ